jgi:Xaa-Pro aminopeptidase
VPSDREVQIGEPLLIDFGCRLDGYCSDLTRTICLGTPEPKLVEIYAGVRAAQDAAEDALRAGARRGREVDTAGWDVLKSSGLIEKPMHSMGHGVGMAVHEIPYISSPRRDDPELDAELKKYEGIGANMIITIEPGVYIPGWGGVRLEDMVLVREDGIEILTDRNPEQIVSVPV